MPNTLNTFLISIGCILTGRWIDRTLPLAPVEKMVEVTEPRGAASEFNCACNCPVIALCSPTVIKE